MTAAEQALVSTGTPTATASQIAELRKALEAAERALLTARGIGVVRAVALVRAALASSAGVEAVVVRETPIETWLKAERHCKIRWMSATFNQQFHVSLNDEYLQHAPLAQGIGASLDEAIADAMNDLMRRAGATGDEP